MKILAINSTLTSELNSLSKILLEETKLIFKNELDLLSKEPIDFFNDIKLVILETDRQSLKKYCSEIRYYFENTPCLVISKEKSKQAKIEALNYGADQFLTTPFEIDELHAVVNSLLRKYKKIFQASSLSVKGIKINLDSFEVFVNDKPINLTSTQFKLLSLLMKNKGKVVSREKILSEIWQTSSENIVSNTIDVHIKEIRKKIQKCSQRQYIFTIRNSGYKFVSI